MKAVILAAGKGERLMPITSSCPKPLIPLAGKPLLEHIILGLKDVGVDEILLIVGYREEMIKNYFANGLDKFNIRIQYITQEEQLGTGHAVSYAENFVNDKPFLLMYGDVLAEPLIFKEIIEIYKETTPTGVMTLLRVQNPQEYGIISLNSNGYVEKITEKPGPELNLGNLANAGIYIFDPLIFTAIKKTEKSIRGEYEFTDSMQILINQFKGKIAGYKLKNYFWSDIGLPWQVLDANSYLLDKIDTELLGNIEENVQISGNVYIGKGTTIRSNSIIEGPCYIGNNNMVGPNSNIRPYTFIANDCHIGMSEIKNSIILSNTTIPNFNIIEDTIICENVVLGRGTKVANLTFDNQNVKVNIKGHLVDSKRKKLGTIIGPNVKSGINVSIMAGKIIYENSHIGANTIVNEDIPSNTLYFHDPNKGNIKKSI